ncbi:MAG TPA: uroporphyrinogen-III C-methyltransferase [Burkholderiales bacterium]|nr:uroporphyrinogen-III C-methyltransferase [Burkholderiales bacterium]
MSVYLVGAGPGAADLLTLRAVRLLGEAGIVFHDALVPAEILALAPQAEKVAVGKRCGMHSTAQRFINKRLADAAQSHAVVVRLKGGDPMLFGRAQDEIRYLSSRGIRVEVVPGITAALAAAAQTGISLTERGLARSVAFVTPRVGDGAAPSSWLEAARAADTVAIYMGAGDAPVIAEALISTGKPAGTPVVLVENASRGDSHTLAGTLAELPELATQLNGGAAMILLGEVLRPAAAAARRPTRKSQAR